MKNRTGELREALAGRIIVDCGYDSEYPCPHAHPTMGYEQCPHEDKDICMWQLEQADEFLEICKEKGLAFVVDRELPVDICQDVIDRMGATREDAGSYKRSQADMLKAGYKPIEEIDIED